VIGELNKIFEKDFVIGYAIPASAFMATTMGLLKGFGRLPGWLAIDPKDPLKDTTFVALITLVLAIVLMAINPMLFRLLEGYWFFDLGHRLNFIQRRRWRRLHGDLDALKKEWEKCQEEDRTFTKWAELRKLAGSAAKDFPSEESLVLPTSFGNTVRAFENYAVVMYNFEPITGWSRLNSVLPAEYREIMDGARADMDLWINTWFLSLITLGEIMALNWMTGLHPYKWIWLATFCVILLASWRARVSAAQWGEWVKGAFDVYLPELSKKMGYSRPPNREEELYFWTELGRAITFRNPEALDAIEKYREKPTSGPEAATNTQEGLSQPAVILDPPQPNIATTSP
jgi:hypothetical protein